MDYPFISLGPTISIIALGLLFALLVVAIGIAGVLAALPGRIATARCHPQAPAVSICGWLGLPTGILWVAALAWAYWRYPATNLKNIDSTLGNLEQAVSKLENQVRGGKQ